MHTEFPAPRTTRSIAFPVVAWVLWTIFLFASVGLFILAEAVKRDRYFAAYYGHHPMTRLTTVMTTYPAWIAMLPLAWLPFVIAYHRTDHAPWRRLLYLLATMSMACVLLAVLIICAGPPIQM